MSCVVLQELVHPFHRQLPFDESDVAGFEPFEACPCCGAGTAPTPLVYLGQPDWKENVAVVQCPDCDLVYYRNPPGDVFLREYYEKTWNRTRGERVEADAKLPTKQSPLVLRFVRALGIDDPKTRFLDIGCGLGHNLAGIVGGGFPEVWGTEMSRYRASLCAARFPDRIFTGGYEGVPAELRFDVVYSNHVFEHLRRPAEAFGDVASRLSDRGIVLLTVPDAWAEDVAHQVFFLPHLTSFAERSLAAIGSRNGFACRFWSGARPGEISAVFFRDPAHAPGAANDDFYDLADSPRRSGSQVERIRRPFTPVGDRRDRCIVYLNRDGNDPDFLRDGFRDVPTGARVVTRALALAHEGLHRLHLEKPRSVLGKRGYLRLRFDDRTAGEAPVIGSPDGRAAFAFK